MKQAPRPFPEKLRPETYARDRMVSFEFKLSAESDFRVEAVLVPLPIVYRLYHLGRAYDLHQVVLLHPTGSSSLSYLPMRYVKEELEHVIQVVNDGAVQQFGRQLVEAIASAQHDTKASLFVRVP